MKRVRNIFRRVRHGSNSSEPARAYIDSHTQFIRNVAHRMCIDPVETSVIECPRLDKTPGTGTGIPRFVEQLFVTSNEYNRKMRDIVEYSTVANGDFVPVEGPLLIRNIISTAIANSSQRMNDVSGMDPIANIEIEQGVPVSELIGDGPAVTKILEELIFNGFRHSLEDEVSIRVWSDKYESTKVYFSVENTGILVPPTELESVFEPFKTTSTSEGVVISKGVGVGLAKSKMISSVLRGALEVDSEETTTFTLTVPFKHSKELVFSNNNFDVNHERGLFSPTGDGLGTHIPGEIGLRVLVVDDSPMILKMFDNMLQKIGVKAEVCLSPIIALEKVGSVKYDVIFLDVVMPVMNGITCAHQIRNGESMNKGTPIIVVTADMTTETRQLTTYISDSILIEKPARINVIARSLASVIKDRKKITFLDKDQY